MSCLYWSARVPWTRTKYLTATPRCQGRSEGPLKTPESEEEVNRVPPGMDPVYPCWSVRLARTEEDHLDWGWCCKMSGASMLAVLVAQCHGMCACTWSCCLILFWSQEPSAHKISLHLPSRRFTPPFIPERRRGSMVVLYLVCKMLNLLLLFQF